LKDSAIGHLSSFLKDSISIRVNPVLQAVMFLSLWLMMRILSSEPAPRIFMLQW